VKALVTGAGGQLASEWAAAAPAGWNVTALTRAQLDIADEGAVEAALSALKPDLILNAAAFTAVDRAEIDPEAAWRTNRDGARAIAQGAARIGAVIVHISTDFVFDGALGRPYQPEDKTAPLNVYGESKRAGEEAVLAAGARALVVRTAWLYACDGRNFMNTMLRLMRERREVRVVADQVGTPTSCASLAAALWAMIELRQAGVRHFTNAGVASWYDFAVAIGEEAQALGLLEGAVSVRPIGTSEYPTPARRPSFSVLDCEATWRALGEPPLHWRQALRATLARIDHPARDGLLSAGS